MEFPVDVLVSGRHEDLESSAQSYMSKLLYSNPENTQYLTLPSTRMIRISLANVGFVPLYGTNLKHKVLALFAPEDLFTAVALFLSDQWCPVEDVLKTSDPAREGLLKVRSVGERIVLYVLNRIVYRTAEMSPNEVPFMCHGEDDFAKILWKNGEAVGFYSVKSKGSLCNSFLSQCYLLPVLNSIFVRKSQRGIGHGLQILEDFVDSFKDDELGLKYPLTLPMQKVCRRYLDTYPADVDLLWEVEGIGGPYQKVKVANKLASLVNCNHRLIETNDDVANEENGDAAAIDLEMSKDSLEMSKDNLEMSKDSLEDQEDVVVVNKHLAVEGDLPISTRTRSSEHRHKKRPRAEAEDSLIQERPEKINRLAEPEEEMEPGDVLHEDGESEGERLEPAPEVYVEKAEANEEAECDSLVLEVNGEMSDSHEEEGSGTDTAEDVQTDQERPPEPELVIQNGASEEDEMDSEEAAQDDIIDSPEVPEELEIVQEQLDQEECIPEDNLDLPVEEKQDLEEALPESEEGAEPEGVDQETQEEEMAVDQEAKNADQPHPDETRDLAEHVSSVQDIDSVDEPDATEDTAASPTVEDGDGVITVNQEDETSSDVPQELQPMREEDENEMMLTVDSSTELQTEPNETCKQKEGNTTEEEEEEQEEVQSSDEAQVPAIVDPTEDEDPENDDAEEMLTKTEEDETVEDEAAEHEEEDEPPVIDRRVLRRKTKVQSTPKPKSKRRSKN